MPIKKLSAEFTPQQMGAFNRAVALYAMATGITPAGCRKMLDEEPQRLMFVVEGLRLINLSVDDSSPLADELLLLIPEDLRKIPFEVLPVKPTEPVQAQTETAGDAGDAEIQVSADVEIADSPASESK